MEGAKQNEITQHAWPPQAEIAGHEDKPAQGGRQGDIGFLRVPPHFRSTPLVVVKRDEQLAAFGDNYNDMTMIGYAGFGVAMGNAETDVKKIADYICESNDNDGIANTLDKFVLKQ